MTPTVRPRRHCALVMIGWLIVSTWPVAGFSASWHHARWDADDGAPTEIESIAQSADGYLWLLTRAGVRRFDGRDFESPLDTTLARRDVTSLAAAVEGGVWLGLRHGDIGRLDDDTFERLAVADDVAGGAIIAIVSQADGSLWVGAASGLAVRHADRWLRIGAEHGYTGQRPLRLLQGRHGRVMVVDIGGVFRQRDDGRFERIAADIDATTHLAQTREDDYWLSDPTHGLRRVGDAGAAQVLARSGPILLDSQQRLWVSTLPGLAWLRDDGAPQPVAQLADTTILSLHEDREGNLWLGTRRGLERLRPARFTSVELPPSLHALAAADRDAMNCPACPTPHTSLFLAMTTAPEGGLIVGSRHTLLHADQQARAMHQLGARISSAHRDLEGVLWLGGEAALWRVTGADVESIALPAAVDHPQDQVQAIARDRDGGVWVSIARKGVYRLADDHWTESGGVAGLPKRPAIALLNDSQSRLWLSYANGHVARLDDDGLQWFDSNDGVPAGPILALHERAGRLWLAGENGIARFDGERFHALHGVVDGVFVDSSGIIETVSGDLWVNGAAGVLRIPATEIEHATRDPAHRVRFERFDHRDGLDGSAEQIRPLPTLVETDDGRLWFATSTTLAWIDPERLRRNTVPPSVVITRLHAGDEVLPSRPEPALPKGTTRVRIDYNALSLTMPERVRFRYRLDGADSVWHEAGDRRSAFYTHLGHGHYRFRVTAANDDGVWNDTGAELLFSIAPTVTQTVWFRVGAVVMLAALIALLYLLRMRQLARQLRQRYEQRQHEHERIARDLHDTLLQGFQGVILRLHAAQRQINDPTAQTSMAAALDRAEAVLIDGRDRVQQLRDDDSDHRLGSALSMRAAELFDADVAFRLVERGTPRRLRPTVRAELFAIVREALFNSARHAAANRVDVVLNHAEDGLDVSVRDNGRGIDSRVLAAGERPGHFGLPGMRERVQRIGATMAIDSSAATGTMISVHVPAALAYARAAAKRSFLRRLLGQ